MTFGWGDPSKVNRPAVEPGAAPDPFHDDTSFPVALYGARSDVRDRGGDITGTANHWVVSRGGECWTARHPDTAVPHIDIGFFPDGYTTISVTDHCAIENPADFSYQKNPYTGRTHLHTLILGVLNGGYAETVTYNATGDWLTATCTITFDGQDIGSGRNPNATGKALREEHHISPAWPTLRAPR